MARQCVPLIHKLIYLGSFITSVEMINCRCCRVLYSRRLIYRNCCLHNFQCFDDDDDIDHQSTHSGSTSRRQTFCSSKFQHQLQDQPKTTSLKSCLFSKGFRSNVVSHGLRQLKRLIRLPLFEKHRHTLSLSLSKPRNSITLCLFCLPLLPKMHGMKRIANPLGGWWLI